MISILLIPYTSVYCSLHLTVYLSYTLLYIKVLIRCLEQTHYILGVKMSQKRAFSKEMFLSGGLLERYLSLLEQ